MSGPLSRNGKREYTDQQVAEAISLSRRSSCNKAAAALGIPYRTIKNWRWGPRGERVNVQ